MTSIDSGFVPASVEDDLEAELQPLRRRRRLPVLTAVLALALVGCGGVLGGVELQKQRGGGSGTASGSFRGGPAAASSRGRRAGGFGFGAAASGGGVTAGTITLIKGSTLYVTDASGNTVKVLTGGARVTKTVTAKVASLSPGDTIVVRGSQAKNGSLQASEITLGSGGGGFGGGGARGFGGGSGSGAPTGFGG